MTLAPVLPGQLRPLRYFHSGGEILMAHNRVIPFTEAPALALRLNTAAEEAERRGDRLARVYKDEARDLAAAYISAEQWRRASFPFFRKA